MLCLYNFNSKEGLKEIKADKNLKSFTVKKGLLWLDVEKPTADEISQLIKTYKFHPALLESLLDHNQPVLQEIDKDYKAFIIKTPYIDKEKVAFCISQLAVICGKNYIISIRSREFSWMKTIIASLEKNPQSTEEKPEILFLKILRRIAEETRIVVAGWENALGDFTLKNIGEINRIGMLRLFNIKSAAERLLFEITENMHIFTHLIEDQKSIIKGKNNHLQECRRVMNIWHSVIEQTEKIVNELDASLDAFRTSCLLELESKSRLNARISLSGFSILTTLILALFIGSRISLPYPADIVLLPATAILIGIMIGKSLSEFLKLRG